MRFIDLEAAIIARLPATLPEPIDWCSTDTPGDLTGTVGVQVAVAVGSDDSLTDSTLLDVYCFAPTREGAFDLAEDVRLGMLSLTATDPSLAGNQLIDTVRTASRPYWLDYRNPATHRVAAAYRVTSRIQ